MTAVSLEATSDITMPGPKTISLPSADSEFRARKKRVTEGSELLVPRSSSPSRALDLSQSRAHDAALDILGAYKLTGNFHVNLEIVLKDIGVLDKVRYEIKSNPKLSYYRDCRHVVFKPNENVPNEMFGEIIKSIKARIGFDAPWWVSLLKF
jgi:outer membrane translocation and assembly module TamA